MAHVRYAVVFGKKDTAERFFPLGEVYLRNADINEAKEIFKSLPTPTQAGDYVVRIYERYYDKHLDPDMDYTKTEFTLECTLPDLDKIIHFLLERNN
jgi:hypothetical protein